MFKGDNNNFLDPEQPRGVATLRREWLVVPSAGAVLEQLRTPRDAAIVAGLAVLLLVGTGAGPGVRRRRRSSRHGAAACSRCAGGSDAAAAA